MNKYCKAKVREDQPPFPIGSELWIKWRSLCEEIKGSIYFCPFWDKPNNHSFDCVGVGRLEILPKNK